MCVNHHVDFIFYGTRGKHSFLGRPPFPHAKPVPMRLSYPPHAIFHQKALAGLPYNQPLQLGDGLLRAHGFGGGSAGCEWGTIPCGRERMASTTCINTCTLTMGRASPERTRDLSKRMRPRSPSAKDFLWRLSRRRWTAAPRGLCLCRAPRVLLSRLGRIVSFLVLPRSFAPCDGFSR